MCVMNKHFELLEFVFNSVYVDLKYNEIYLRFTTESVCFCSHVVALGLSVRLSMYTLWMRWLRSLMRVLLFVLHMSMVREYERVRLVRAMPV